MTNVNYKTATSSFAIDIKMLHSDDLNRKRTKLSISTACKKNCGKKENN